MVKIKPLMGLLPKNPKEFCTNPYDIIEKKEEEILKTNPNSLIHLILPDGINDDKYLNAKKAFETFCKKDLFQKISKPSIFVYRQESKTFCQEGFILGLAIEDYETGKIKKHEHTREKPLQDRIKIYNTTHVIPGLVWCIYKRNNGIKQILNKIKLNPLLMDFELNGYRQMIWQETNSSIISELTQLFALEELYIADGHHRAAAAADYRKKQILKEGNQENKTWQYLLTYVASDNEVRILPYNRLIKKLNMNEIVFLEKVKKNYDIIAIPQPFSPKIKYEIAMCMKGHWYRLFYRGTEKILEKNFDVAILQEKVLEPILGIKDPRNDENLSFIGGITNPHKMEEYMKEQQADILFNIFPVSIYDLEAIADKNGVMPPKSTWFDPKLLSGLILHLL